VLLHYLGKHKAENCIFSLKFWVVLPADTENTFILSLGHSWTTPCSHKNQPYAPNKTSEASTACYRLLPHTHRSPSLWWCRSLCQKWELFLVEPQVKSKRTVLVGYLTISTYVSCYQTLCRQQYYLPFSNIAHACTSACMVSVTQFNSGCTKLSASFLLSYSPQQARAELN